MDETRSDHPTNNRTTARGRRGALRVLGSTGVAILAALGLSDASAKKKKRKKSKVQVGPVGPGGPPGPAGISGYERVQGPGGYVLKNLSKEDTAMCPSGKNMIGGGYALGGASNDFKFINIGKNHAASDSEWVVLAYQDSGFNDSWSIHAFAICANVT
jgi:hypothetical protein